MRSLILGLAVAVAASGAQAQVSRCGMEFGKWVCRTDQPTPMPRQSPMQTGADAFMGDYVLCKPPLHSEPTSDGCE